ncbi:asparagine synthase (glutamine-hydrolysing) [Pseudonocardia ammonioxydans]|uniref:asparagine synthase (glutamine-hydrolyzing) n=1 Tax=Pseudonocardia ammonioxydans TaxID=260086 RepID=A0A1I4U1A3_PSUAM|nr:asparagine synthase (glutamine-hydrolyzing) [Pseudonocardia ammonioxydans]SFM82812.1 asparagine synthase (glutamine-hydrolysing) [Pseudonocardia ammonioxydans]
MCGICGWIDHRHDLGADEHARTLAAMNETMACRGPDQQGVWAEGPAALCHRRLAVIDVEGGRQPMSLDDDGEPALHIVYSGETYNFRELREQLAAAGHRFRTASDTEVVLRAHREWGRRDPRDVARRLNGMFAYALWDTATQELVLVRDRLGIKPLYYLPTPHGVLFGSEPKAILANPLADRTVDADGLRRALVFVADPSNAVFRGMREVPPGCIVRIGRSGDSGYGGCSGCREERYWQLADTGHTDDVDTTVGHVRELLEDTVERQLYSDVSLCTLLSGGLDSSALTALAARHVPEPVRSFAVDFAGHADNFTADDVRGTPDTPYVHEVAKWVGTDHRDIVLRTEDLMDPAARAATLHARDLPAGIGDMDTSLYLLFRAVRQESTVALSGESADEVFGGYRDFHDADTIAADTFPWLAGRMLNQDQRDPGLFDQALWRALDVPGYVEDQYRAALAEVPELTGPAADDPHERRMREVCYLYLTRFLPVLLDRKDRMSMAVGLEVRVPFCDHRLVEYVFGTPWAHKTFDGREKSLLRHATTDLLPESVVQRVKSPYPSTQDAGYETSLRERVTAILNEGDDAPVAPLVDRAAVRARLDAPAGRTPMGERMQLERMVDLNTWIRDLDVTLAV